MRKLIGLSALGIFFAGCAGLDAHAPGDGDTVKGFRYFDTAPFLLVYTDGKGGVISKLMYLPDTTRLRTIHPYAYGAKNEVTLKFDKGRLTQAASTVDETVIPMSVISGLEKIAVARLNASAPRRGIPAPYLFRISTDELGNWQLKGGQAMVKGVPLRVPYE